MLGGDACVALVPSILCPSSLCWDDGRGCLRCPHMHYVKRLQPHPRATARVPAPLHPTPALTKTTKQAVADQGLCKLPCNRDIHGWCWSTKQAVADQGLCKGGGRVDEWMGPLRSPLGGALL